MLNYKILLYLCLLPQFAAASFLNVSKITDPGVNQPLVQLVSNESYTGLEQRQLTSAGLNALLAYMAPQIKQLPGYTGLFVANCSIFINTQVDEVNCEIIPVASVALQAGYHVAPGPRLPPQYGSQITRSSILLVSMFADWTRRKTEFSEQYELVLYDRVWTCSETVTLSDTLQTQTNIASESNSLTQPETPSSIISETLSVTQTQTSTQTGSNTLSASDSRTHSGSESMSQTISDTKSNSNFISGTRSLSASDSLSGSNSPTFAETASKTLTRLSGLLAAWNQSTGVYQDATTQGSRYNSSANIVSDALTGLQWELIPSVSTMTWAQAVDYCVASRTGTYDDWRLPNNAELESLVDYTIPYRGLIPGINSIFNNTPTNYFYSSTPLVGSPTQQPWWMSFGQTACYSGLLFSLQYSPSCAPAVAGTGYARCVRSPYRPLPAIRYTTTSDTVTDTITGLIWQRVSTGGPMNQTAALAYCSALSLPSFSTGWRLPKVKELATLVDYSVPYSKLMMDATVFAGEPVSWFWSSTPVAGNPSRAWFADFGNGYLSNDFVTSLLYVRCLR